MKRTAILLALGLALMFAIPAVMAMPVQAQSEANYKLMPPAAHRDVFYGGSTLPVKFILTDEDGHLIMDASATILVDGSPGVPTGKMNSGNMFVFNDGQYTYLLNTKPLAAGPGSPTHMIEIDIMLSDGSTMTEMIGPFSLT